MLPILLPRVRLTLVAHLRDRPLQVSYRHVEPVELRVLHPDHPSQCVLLLLVPAHLLPRHVVLGLQVCVLPQLLVQAPDLILIEKTLVFVGGRLMD
jgi:hypothetical protein